MRDYVVPAVSAFVWHNLKQLCTFVCILTLTLAVSARDSQAGNDCSLTVRAIKGSHTASDQVRSQREELMLADLHPHLKRLGFEDYRILYGEERQIRTGEMSRFRVISAEGESHSLNVTPIFGTSSEVELVVEWLGTEGEELLSTGLRIMVGQTAVLGADSTDGAGTIVSVTPRCY